MRFHYRSIGIVIATLMLEATPLFSQDSFFKGKTMRIIVGGPPGGGFGPGMMPGMAPAGMMPGGMAGMGPGGGRLGGMGVNPDGVADDHRRQYAGRGHDDRGKSCLQSLQAGWTHDRPFHRQSNHQSSFGIARRRV